MTPKKKAAAFPPPVDEPKAPAFGWICNPARLTGNEVDAITAACGISPLDESAAHDPARITKVAAYIAVAYARRIDPDLPWDAAGRIPTTAMAYRFPDEDEREEQHAAAVEKALEEGEEAPDPT